MLYIVRVYEDGDIFEYEYGNLKHAQEHLSFENCYAELYEWQNDTEKLICTVNSNSCLHFHARRHPRRHKRSQIL